jgi:hypothetical protein
VLRFAVIWPKAQIAKKGDILCRRQECFIGVWALIIPSATPDDPPLQARSTGEAGYKAFEKSGPYPRLPKVADDVIEAGVCRIF